MRTRSTAAATLALTALTALTTVAACSADAPAPTAPSGAPASAATSHAGAHAASHAAPAGNAVPRQVAAVRAATARYHRVEAALADGYVNTGECVAMPGTGGMGVHFMHPARLADGVIDPTRPEVLMYEPNADGSYRLIGVEYAVFRAPWEQAHPEGATPTFAGVAFAANFGDPNGAPDHYGLHLWAWRENPSGLFAPFNPKVTCP